MAELVRLRDRQQDLAAAGIAVIAVSTQTPEESREGAARHRLAFPVAADEHCALLTATGLRHAEAGPAGDLFYSSSFLLDHHGTVRFALTHVNTRLRADPDEVIAAARAAAAAAH